MADEQLRQIKKNEEKIIKKEEKRIVENPLPKNKEEKKEYEKTDINELKKSEEKKEKPKIKTKAPKRNYASVYGKGLKISLIQSKGIGKFIKGKSIDRAINELEMVVKKKIAIPMKGEFPHRKGKVMAGKFPKNASKEFIRLLKSLNANAIQHSLNLDKTIIKEVIPNKAANRLHRFGSRKFKQTHILIRAKEISHSGEKD